MPDESDFENEIKHAKEAFKSAMGGGGSKNRGGSETGHTFWDIVARHSHLELEDMIHYLERNARKMSPRQLVEHHVQIVDYLDRIGHLNVPGTEGLNAADLQYNLSLYHREDTQKRLEGQLYGVQHDLRNTREVRARLDGYFQILHAHFYLDRRSLIAPEELQKKLEDSALQMRAYRLYLRETKGDLSQSPGESSSVTDLITLEPGAQFSKEALVKSNLDDRVVAYMAVSHFMTYFERRMEEGKSKEADLKRDLQNVRLTHEEYSRLREFESGSNRTYSPSNYFAIYTNAVWAQIENFFVKLHKSGIKVTVNVNI
ncbi:hypothetical protein HYS31_00300 [Candidatus Woesearchaeota archaeon]|nr:hypothetical protein [Candidatus Woesearchaeota archaeon]